MRIDPVLDTPTIQLPERVSGPTSTPATTPSEISFESILGGVVERANTSERAATAKAEALAAGAADDLHGTMIAVKEAEINMKLLGSIRNKLLDAFHEIWRTSV